MKTLYKKRYFEADRIITKKLEVYKKQYEEQKKVENERKKWDIIEAIFPIFLYLLPFILLIGFLVWGYFYFAVPIIRALSIFKWK